MLDRFISLTIILSFLSCGIEDRKNKERSSLHKKRTERVKVGSKNLIEEVKEIPFEDPNAIWKYGVAIKNGVPKYFDPTRVNQYSPMLMPDYYRNKVKMNIISGFRLAGSGKNAKGTLSFSYWNKDKNDAVYGDYGVKFQGRNIETRKTKQLHYHLTNDSVYLSEDQTNWEKLEIEFLSDKPLYDLEIERVPPKEDLYHGIGIYWKMHLKSSWFEGEYIITSMHIDR